ncbi:hypothetical protein [Streptomyces hundungensis]|uniref:hypothetical protein n=1 Tax=Streptomyces hundungensis TaxID=1077946 RepID=UPI0031F00B82
MKGWSYEVQVCESGGGDPTDHDGECGPWTRKSMHWNHDWFEAFEKATLYDHALVEAIPVGIDPGWKPHVTFEHIRGGGQCKGCWQRYVNTQSEHAVSEPCGQCQPCADTQKRRGPLTRTPFGTEFMCDDCRTMFRRLHVQQSREPDKRLYRTALEVAREDAGGEAN